MRILIKGGVWKNTEDEILKAAVMKYGKNQWARVASLLSRKSAKQCKARWYEWLDPSIKKTEWHRDEEEKLLHLAKLMPNQWRTIAPIVGRTAAQCMEHYEKLLDQAQESAEGVSSSSGVTGTADDPRRLRPGEIDPTPETKPARPDPIDMDNDEKEMLSEARARLANTVGKKVKRKARERQLEEARKLTILQKRRELRAAGLESKLGGGNKKRKYIDYAHEIPFQKVAPVGFYDVGEENEQSRKLSKAINPKQMGLDIATLEGRHATEEAEREKRQDEARLKKLFKANAPLAVMKVNDQQDAAVSLRRRTALALPAPQVSDLELDDIVRMNQHNLNTLAAIEGEDGQGGGLIGDYQTTYAPQPQSQAAARTPMHEDIVMQEARNLRVLREMTPLVETDDNKGLGTLYEGTGFQGMAPRKAVLATPNTILGATPGPGSGAIGGETPMSTTSYGSRQSHVTTSSAVDKYSLVRDQFGLNDPSGAVVRSGNGSGSVARAAAGAGALGHGTNDDIDIDSVYDDGEGKGEEDDNLSVMTDVTASTFGGGGGRVQGRGGRSNNRLPLGFDNQSHPQNGLKTLPEPEFTYKFKIPELPSSHRKQQAAAASSGKSMRVTVEDVDDEEEEEGMHGSSFIDEDEEEEEITESRAGAGSSAYLEDRTDTEEKEAQRRVDIQRRELKNRSTVFQRAHADPTSVIRPSCVSKLLLLEKPTATGAVGDAAATTVKEMIRSEMCAVIAYDSYLSPVEPTPALSQAQVQHSNTCIAALTAPPNARIDTVTNTRTVHYPGSSSNKYMTQAREYIEQEVVAAATTTTTGSMMLSLDEFTALWEEAYKTKAFVPTIGGNGTGGRFRVPVNKTEIIAGYECQLSELRTKIQRDQKKIAKLEQKITVGTKGYQLKLAKCVGGSDLVNSAVSQLQHGEIELSCFGSLYEYEHGHHIDKRLAEARSFTAQAEAIEAALQKQYAQRMEESQAQGEVQAPQ